MKAITRILAAGLLALATGAGTTATPASLATSTIAS